MGLFLPGQGFAFAFVPLHDVPTSQFLQPVELLWPLWTHHWTRGVEMETKRSHVNSQCGIVESHLHIQAKENLMTGMELMTISAIIIKWANYHMVLQKLWEKMLIESWFKCESPELIDWRVLKIDTWTSALIKRQYSPQEDLTSSKQESFWLMSSYLFLFLSPVIKFLFINFWWEVFFFFSPLLLSIGVQLLWWRE